MAAEVETVEIAIPSAVMTVEVEVPGAPGSAGPQGPKGEGILLLEAGEQEPPEDTPVGTIVYRKVG